jgi:hypothetical protein
MTIGTLNPAAVGDLYSETINPRNPVPIPRNLSRSIMAEIGSDTGVLPVDNGLGVDPMEVPNEPHYTGSLSEYLRTSTRNVTDKIKRYFERKDGAVPYLGDVNVSAAKLPTYWGIFLQKTKDGLKAVPKIIGKVYGAFDPRTNDVYIDPVTFNRNDPEAKYMIMKHEGVEKTAAHEFAHVVQKKAGTLSRHTRADVEAEAELMAADITGTNPSAYPKERASFNERYSNWITNIGDCARGVKRNYIDPIVESLTPQPTLVPVRVSSYRVR